MVDDDRILDGVIRDIDVDLLGAKPKTMGDELNEELEWFFGLTGRDPEVIRCSRSTLRQMASEEMALRRYETPRCLAPFAAAVVGLRGSAVPVQVDNALPLGSWRAE